MRGLRKFGYQWHHLGEFADVEPLGNAIRIEMAAFYTFDSTSGKLIAKKIYGPPLSLGGDSVVYSGGRHGQEEGPGHTARRICVVNCRWEVGSREVGYFCAQEDRMLLCKSTTP